MLLTRRIGINDAPWQVLILRNEGGDLKAIVCEDGVGLPEMDGKGLSVSEALAPPRAVGAYHNYWSLWDYLGGKEWPFAGRNCVQPS